ncbi:hypothetical protein EON63_16450 [archaeon]|nr:MAG: hypothetical protein EON63_16450 [archaeon]
MALCMHHGQNVCVSPNLFVLKLLMHNCDVFLGIRRLACGVKRGAVVHVSHPDDMVELLRDVDVLVSRASAPQDLHDRRVAVLAVFDTLVVYVYVYVWVCVRVWLYAFV